MAWRPSGSGIDNADSVFRTSNKKQLRRNAEDVRHISCLEQMQQTGPRCTGVPLVDPRPTSADSRVASEIALQGPALVQKMQPGAQFGRARDAALIVLPKSCAISVVIFGKYSWLLTEGGNNG